MIERHTMLALGEGLHARPAARIALCAAGFSARVEVLRQGRVANAKSTVELMLLGIKGGETITIRASGLDAEAAVEAVAALFEGYRQSGAGSGLTRSAGDDG